jgi:hypothetical protein
MKRFIAFAILFVFLGCHKTDNQSGTGYWYINQAYHSVGFTSRRDSAGAFMLTAAGAPSLPGDSTNKITLWLGSLPEDSASFAIFDFDIFGVPTGLPGKNQLGVSGFRSDYKSCSGWGNFHASMYSSMSSWPWTLADSATLTVSNGKIKVVIPQLIADLWDRCGNDSPSLRALIQEK